MIDPTIIGPWVALAVSLGGGLALLYRAVRRLDSMYRKDKRQDADTAMLLQASLACLDGLAQLKCNGKVTEAKNQLTAHLIKSHMDKDKE